MAQEQIDNSEASVRITGNGPADGVVFSEQNSFLPFYGTKTSNAPFPADKKRCIFLSSVISTLLGKSRHFLDFACILEKQYI